jgi:hypothetical protein
VTQPMLIETPPRRVRRRVRDTSIQQYAEARDRLKGRQADVLRWLAHWWNAKQTSPTSAELVAWLGREDRDGSIISRDRTADLLYVRRGLSDLQTHGLVETVEKRICAVTGRMCRTWRVKSR